MGLYSCSPWNNSTGDIERVLLNVQFAQHSTGRLIRIEGCKRNRTLENIGGVGSILIRMFRCYRRARDLLVEPMGFEPTASSMPSRRAPNCATAPPEMEIPKNCSILVSGGQSETFTVFAGPVTILQRRIVRVPEDEIS